MIRGLLYFRTPAGRLYEVHKDGQITVAGSLANKDWKFIGLQHVRRNEIIFLKDLTNEFLKDFNPCWKNGNPQWTVRDNDHGTMRIWGNTKYNGVAKIYRY